MVNEKRRNKYLDVVKGVLILIVVFRHIFQIAANNSDTDYLCNLMAVVEMPLFMAISGYFSLPRLFDKSDNYKLINKIKKISLGYLIPFFSYFFVFRLFFYSRYEGFSSIKIWTNNITESLWYLFAIWVLNIFAIISFWVAKHFFNKHVRIAMFTTVYLACLCAYLVMGVAKGFNFLGCKLILYYGVYYLLGYLFLNFQDDLLAIFEKTKEIIVFLCLCIYFVGSFKLKVLVVPDTLLFIVLRFVLALAGVLTILYLSYILYQKFKCTVIEKIGINTLEIYYVHSFLLNSLTISKATTLLSVSGFINVFTLTIYIVALSIAILFIIKHNSVMSFLLLGKKYDK